MILAVRPADLTHGNWRRRGHVHRPAFGPRIVGRDDAVGCSIQEVAMMGVHGQKINNIIIFVQNVDLNDKNG